MNRALLVLVCGLCVAGWLGCAASPKGQVDRQEADGARQQPEQADELSAGRTIYDENCASCHRLGRYDSQGSRNLAQRAGDLDSGFLAEHHGSSLTAADIASLKAFISHY